MGSCTDQINPSSKNMNTIYFRCIIKLLNPVKSVPLKKRTYKLLCFEIIESRKVIQILCYFFK